MDMVDEKAKARFWAKVERGKPDECWNWTATTNRVPCGLRYGMFYLQRKQMKAHRVSYFMASGVDPTGSVVRHKCDNSLCVNPAHLELGTQKDNVADRDNRGRSNYQVGEKHGNAKLTTSDVLAIREAKRNGEKVRDIARRFNVSVYAVFHASKYGWKHI